MKKLFALALIAGSLSFIACEGEATETETDTNDSPAVEQPVMEETPTTPDSPAAPADSPMMPADSPAVK